VEAEIFKRLETKALPRPASPYDGLGAGRPSFGSSSLPPGGSFGSASSRPPTGAKPAGTGSSFLDEWLAKRQENVVRPTAAPAGSSAPLRPETPKPAAKPQAAQGPAPHLEAAVDKNQSSGEFKIDRDI